MFLKAYILVNIPKKLSTTFPYLPARYNEFTKRNMMYEIVYHISTFKIFLHRKIKGNYQTDRQITS